MTIEWIGELERLYDKATKELWTDSAEDIRYSWVQTAWEIIQKVPQIIEMAQEYERWSGYAHKLEKDNIELEKENVDLRDQLNEIAKTRAVLKDMEL